VSTGPGAIQLKRNGAMSTASVRMLVTIEPTVPMNTPHPGIGRFKATALVSVIESATLPCEYLMQYRGPVITPSVGRSISGTLQRCAPQNRLSKSRSLIGAKSTLGKLETAPVMVPACCRFSAEDSVE
jgi:hypothetical protein